VVIHRHVDGAGVEALLGGLVGQQPGACDDAVEDLDGLAAQ
jgi:hypothetical protein